MSAGIFQAVQAYLAKGLSPFHMPGHKGRGLEWLSAQMDITEVAGADSLYQASEAILRCEQGYAAHYGSRGSFLSAGGATLCIQAMLALVAKPGSRVVAPRMNHASAVRAMGLLGLEPAWVWPQADASGLPLPATPEQIAKVLDATPQACAVYITSPDYFGRITHIAPIVALCRSRGLPLLVDNAHGAHLQFFGCHPLQQGADMTADSLHKSLPVLTGGAVLHLARQEYLPFARQAMALFGSTSPSYLILASADAALARLQGELGPRMRQLAEQLAELKTLAERQGLPALDTEPLRLCLCYGRAGWSDQAFNAYLRQSGLEPEYAHGGICVLMASPFNTPQDLARLRNMLQGFTPTQQALPPLPPMPGTAPARRLPLREALLAPRRQLPVAQAAGYTCAQVVATCPPGIPLLLPGEVVSPGTAALLQAYGITAIDVI